MAEIDLSVVKSYDIRGVYPQQLDARFAYLLGRALPAVLPVDRVALGHDARTSSPELYLAMAAGFASGGVEVGRMGLCPTEFVYYALGSGHAFDLGVMITASHNPPEYNGFKVVSSGAEPVTGATGLRAACELMVGMSAVAAESAPDGPPDVAPSADYLQFAFRLAGKPEVKGARVVVDAGNGVGGLLWELLAEPLGVDVIRLNFEPDGRFPAHPPDPSRRENLQELVRRVTDEGADIGFCYDGDADRVVAVLPDGHLVDGSEMIVCLTESLFGADAGGRAPVFGVAQSTCRKALDHFRSKGLDPVLTPVGHSKIKQLMRSEPEMVFAGEDAGHYYYRDFFCSDSALITTLHLLHLVSDGRLTPLIAGLPGPWFRPQSEPGFRFDDGGHATDVCRRVALAALKKGGCPAEITCEREGRIARRCTRSDVEQAEGVRVDYEDWWFCVRPSGTEPIARLSLEARRERALAKRTQWLSGLFERLR